MVVYVQRRSKAVFECISVAVKSEVEVYTCKPCDMKASLEANPGPTYYKIVAYTEPTGSQWDISFSEILSHSLAIHFAKMMTRYMMHFFHPL